jgi:hypothetical protein
VRANARTLPRSNQPPELRPEATNRRAVLGAVLAAGAAASIPAVAAASVAPGPHPDADLFALIERAKVADTVSTHTYTAADNLLGGKLPELPEGLFWNESDATHWHRAKAGNRISDHDVAFLRDWLKRPAHPEGLMAPELGLFVPLIPSASFVERTREIVKKHDEYKAALRAAHEHPDVIEAEDRNEAARGRWEELADRVATTPAKTLEGILAKLVLISSGYSEEDVDGTYDGILASAALDAQAMANEARS